MNVSKADYSSPKNQCWHIEAGGRKFTASAHRVYRNSAPGSGRKGARHIYYHVHVVEVKEFMGPGETVALFTAYSAPRRKILEAIQKVVG